MEALEFVGPKWDPWMMGCVNANRFKMIKLDTFENLPAHVRGEVHNDSYFWGSVWILCPYVKRWIDIEKYCTENEDFRFPQSVPIEYVEDVREAFMERFPQYSNWYRR